MKKLLLLTIVLITAASCSSIKISSDFDRTAAFSSYKTYSFTNEALTLPINELNLKRVLTAVEDRTGRKRIYEIRK